jgi:hypothetical protein
MTLIFCVPYPSLHDNEDHPALREYVQNILLLSDEVGFGSLFLPHAKAT